ncbi:MAG: hypothetical protein ACKV2T_12635 [Kofleriaceae bacterium]
MGRPAGIRFGTAVLAPFIASGCAQLAGIDITEQVDEPELASLTLSRISIGATVTTRPLDLANLSASYLIANPDAPDGFDRITATVDPMTPNKWVAEVGESTPPVMFTLPDYPEAVPRIWALPNRELVGALYVFEHPDPQPAIDPATLTVQATLPTPYAATESFQLLVVGTWVSRGFSGMMEVPAVGSTAFGPVPFAYTTTSPQTNRPYEGITTADATLLLRYVGTRLTGVMEGPPFDQTGMDTVMGTMSAVAATETLSATLNNMTVAARYMPLRPMMPAPTMSWSLVAAPGFASASLLGPRLNSDTVLATDPSAISVPYGNPFASKGWPTAFMWSTSSSRMYTPPGAVGPITLSAGVSQFATPSPDMTLDLPAGLPELITLDQQPLSMDGVAIDKPIKALAASFIVPPTPASTLFQLALYELVPNSAGTALEHKHILTMTSVEASFLIPPEFFQSGRSYTLRAQTIAGGYPALGSGDLTMRALPVAVGFMDSGVVLVN